MKKILTLLLSWMLLGAGTLWAQGTYDVKLNYRNATLGEVLKSFTDQTGIVFSYESSLTDKTLPSVDVNLSGADLGKCLDAVLAGSGIKYRISGGMVALTQGNEPPAKPSPRSTPRTWAGLVVDGDGAPIPGVAVFIAGTTTGAAITNEKGSFSITAKAEDEIQFSCLGYETVTLKAGSPLLKRVVLKDEAQVLETSVVTALGIKRDEKALGYSAQKVEAEKFANSGTTGNWLNGISGQVAGLNIDRTNSGPGGSMRVTIRGEATTDLENNTALFVVDGVPMYNTATMSEQAEGSSFAVDYGNGTADIDPDNIESVTVLKGAAATALYGSQAANGAIIITTKSAERQEGNLQVSFKSSFAADRVLSEPDLQYEYGQGDDARPYYYYLRSGDGEEVMGINPRPDYSSTASMNSWGPKMDGTPYYQYYNEELGIGGHYDGSGNFVRDETPFKSLGNWFNRYFRTGLTFSNALTLSGRWNKDNSIRISFSDNRSSGIVPNSPSRYNFLSLRTRNKLTKWLNIESSVNYKHNTNPNIPTSSGYGSTAIMYGLWCYAPNVDMNWAQNYWLDEAAVQQDASLSGGKNNAYFLAYECVNDQKRDRLYGNIKADADLAKGLVLTLRAGMDMTSDFRTQTQATSTQARPQGWYREQDIDSKQYSADFLLRYNKKFRGEFDLTATFGGSMFDRSYSKHSQEAGTINVPGIYSLVNSKSDIKVSNSSYERMTNSLYGLLSLSWKNAVFLDVTGRNDWSSTLPKGNRSYFYPSVSGSIALNDLFDFGRTNGLVNLMKIRASWAQVGHDTSPYRTVDYLSDTGFPGTVSLPTTKTNPDLRPERVSSWEVGLELKMFKNRFSLDAAFYDSTTKDLISQMPISIANGVNAIFVNAGSIRNRGFEISASGTLIKTRDIQWKIGANWTMNKNTVLELGEGIDSWIIGSYSTHAYMTAYEGGSITCMYGKGYKRAPEGSVAINAEGKMVDVSGLMVLDRQTMPQTDTELQLLGDCAPIGKGGFNTTFKWKGLSFYIGFDGQIGGHVFSYTNWVLNYRGKGKATLPGREDGLVPVGVKETADGNYVINTDAVPASNIATYYGCLYEQTNAEAHFVSTQFLKLREVRIEYTFPKRLLAKTKFISDLSLAAYGNNLYCWTPFPGFDPEGVTMRGSAVVPGFEILQMPSAAQFGATLNIVF